MYRVIIVCTTCLFFTHAAVIPNESEAEIVKYENTNDGAGNYKFSFETSNGSIRKETGHLVNIGEKDEHMVVEGYYSYKDFDGNRETVYYTADENGYHVIPNSDFEESKRLEPNVVATLLGK